VEQAEGESKGSNKRGWGMEQRKTKKGFAKSARAGESLQKEGANTLKKGGREKSRGKGRFLSNPKLDHVKTKTGRSPSWKEPASALGREDWRNQAKREPKNKGRGSRGKQSGKRGKANK